MKNYVQLLTDARKALTEKYLAKPRGDRLSEWHFLAAGIAYDVILDIQRGAVDVDNELPGRAERSLKDMRALSVALDRDRHVARPADIRRWKEEAAEIAEIAAEKAVLARMDVRERGDNS
jgi:hypothetical protein